MSIRSHVDLSVQWVAGDFTKDFDYIIKRVFVDKTPTAFARYNEWEFGLISKQWFVGAWWMWKTHEDKLSLCNDLHECLQTEEEWYYFWIASNQHPAANSYYKHVIPSKNITFATLFVNNNWKRRREIYPKIREHVVLVANARGRDNEYPFTISEYVSVPFDVVSYYEEYKDVILWQCEMLAEQYKNKLFLFAAWPLSNIMIDYLWSLNKTNRYIDVWSTLDEHVMGRKTRNYFHENRTNFNRIDQI